MLQTSLLDPVPLRTLWTLLNRSHHVDASALRLACVLLLVTYIVSSIIRHMPGIEQLTIRAVVIAYALIGAVFAPRFSWPMLRAYTVGIAILLPVTTALLAALRGNHPADLALTALSIFAPNIFLQTAMDVALVAVVQAAGIVALVVHWGPPGVPLSVAAIVLVGALAAGGTTALVLIGFRGRVSESTAWWQEACARERTLREFVELAAPHLGDQVLAREFAARFVSGFGTGYCAVVLLDPVSGTPRLAATAGVAPAEAAGRGPPAPAALDRLLGAVADRQPLVRAPVTDDDVERRFAGVPWPTRGGTLVLLPIASGDAVAGVVVLSAAGERRVSDEDLLLWRAMANQAGVAVGSARLFSRLQDALRARSELIHTMSHEMRSPLHVIVGYSDMLADGRGDAAFIATRMRASGLELLQLLEDTLAAARLGTGKVPVQPTEFPLAELVAELRESIAALPEAAAGVPVRWELGDELPVVRIDRLKVKEIVHNLVSNALKFTSRGEVRVRIGCDDHQLRIDVEDTGAGIADDARARIFEKFERVETMEEPHTPGVGLGLYIVKSLVHMLGGTIALASEPSRGSRFTVWLPLAGA